MGSSLKTRILIAALMLAAACAAPVDEDAPLVLTYGSPYSPGHPFSKADIIWMDHIEAASGGRIIIRPYWGGGLLSSEESMLEVRHGVVDIGLITPIYALGGAQLLRTQAGFYGGVKSYDQQLDLYACLSQTYPEFDEETEGLKVLAVQGGNLPGVLTRGRPVGSIADFSGLRLRAPVELMPLLEEVGADPVTMPMGDVYSAMAKGVLDGVVAPADTILSLHFDEVASYFSAARFSRGAYPARAMSAKTWARLSPDEQSLLEASIPVWEGAMRNEITGAESKGAAYGQERGIEFVPFDPSDQKRLDALYNLEAMKAAQGLRLTHGTAERVYQGARTFIDDPDRGACGQPATDDAEDMESDL